jgi:hypothetical protein
MNNRVLSEFSLFVLFFKLIKKIYICNVINYLIKDLFFILKILVLILVFVALCHLPLILGSIFLFGFFI